ncbi:hypothetical protein T439DRAFT_376451 [Meredithblackwellia eburnea MCA 4105]
MSHPFDIQLDSHHHHHHHQDFLLDSSATAAAIAAALKLAPSSNTDMPELDPQLAADPLSVDQPASADSNNKKTKQKGKKKQDMSAIPSSLPRPSPHDNTGSILVGPSTMGVPVLGAGTLDNDFGDHHLAGMVNFGETTSQLPESGNAAPGPSVTASVTSATIKRDDEAHEEKPKRGPGRPRKSEEQRAMEKAERVARKAAERGPKKKRGRPVGTKNKPGHKAGRPRKDQTAGSSAATPEVKTPDLSTVTFEGSSFIDESLLADGAAGPSSQTPQSPPPKKERGRVGRPRKVIDPNAPPKEKKPRGRPRKVNPSTEGSPNESVVMNGLPPASSPLLAGSLGDQQSYGGDIFVGSQHHHLSLDKEGLPTHHLLASASGSNANGGLPIGMSATNGLVHGRDESTEASGSGEPAKKKARGRPSKIDKNLPTLDPALQGM